MQTVLEFIAAVGLALFCIAGPFIAGLAVNAVMPGMGAIALAVALLAFPVIACRIAWGPND